MARALDLEQAQWSLLEDGDRRATFAAQRWCHRDLAPLSPLDPRELDAAAALALDRTVAAPHSARVH